MSTKLKSMPRRAAPRSLTEAESGLIAPALMLAAGLIRRAGNLTYKAQLGLSSIEWTLIARLGKSGPMTQADLAEVSQYDKGQISRAISRLERKRLISREALTWRSEELSLQAAGLKVFGHITRISRQRQQIYTRDISDRDLRQFCKTLDVIGRNANALLSSLRKLQERPG